MHDLAGFVTEMDFGREKPEDANAPIIRSRAYLAVRCGGDGVGGAGGDGWYDAYGFSGGGVGELAPNTSTSESSSTLTSAAS